MAGGSAAGGHLSGPVAVRAGAAVAAALPAPARHSQPPGRHRHLAPPWRLLLGLRPLLPTQPAAGAVLGPLLPGASARLSVPDRDRQSHLSLRLLAGAEIDAIGVLDREQIGERS